MEWLRECEKGVFTATHPRNPFQGKYPPPVQPMVEQNHAGQQRTNYLSISTYSTEVAMYTENAVDALLALDLCS